MYNHTLTLLRFLLQGLVPLLLPAEGEAAQVQAEPALPVISPDQARRVLHDARVALRRGDRDRAVPLLVDGRAADAARLERDALAQRALGADDHALAHPPFLAHPPGDAPVEDQRDPRRGQISLPARALVAPQELQPDRVQRHEHAPRGGDAVRVLF